MVKKILWIDDDDDVGHRRIAAQRINAKFIDRETQLTTVDLTKYNLILIDFLLDTRPGRFSKRGFELGTMIAEKVPSALVYLISNKFQESEVKKLKFHFENNFPKVMDFNHIDSAQIRSDLADYEKIKQKNPRSADEVIKLLAAPKSVTNRLKPAIPVDTYLSNDESKRYLSTVRWINHVLLKMPGFVNNSEESAAHLGITPLAFKKLSTKLRAAKYIGIFSGSNEPRWWIDEIDTIILSNRKARKESTSNVSKLIETVYSLGEKSMVKCPVCKQKYTDTYAFEHESDGKYNSVHFSCSEEDPDRKKEIFFDVPRRYHKVETVK